MNIGMTEKELQEKMTRKTTKKNSGEISYKSVIARTRKGVVAKAWLKRVIPTLEKDPERNIVRRSSLIEVAREELTDKEKELYVREANDLKQDVLPLIVTAILHDSREKNKVEQLKVKGYWKIDIPKFKSYLEELDRKYQEVKDRL